MSIKNFTLISIILITIKTISIAQNEKVWRRIHLKDSDAFIIAQYEEIEYSNIPHVEDKKNSNYSIPNNLSFQNFYFLNDKSQDSNKIVDLNYLYLQNFHRQDSGRLYYLISVKTPPENRHNIIDKKEIGRYFEISSIGNIEYGYWIKNIKEKDIVLIFRSKTKIKSMKDFRIFYGKITNDGFYLTHAMNVKDDYLFNNKFKRSLDKNIHVKLPIELNQVFNGCKIKDPNNPLNSIVITVKYWNKKSFDEKFNIIEAKTYRNEQGITFDFISLTLEPITRRKNFNRQKFVLLRSENKNNQIIYKRIKVKKRHNYFKMDNIRDEEINLIIHVPEKKNDTRKLVIQYPN